MRITFVSPPLYAMLKRPDLRFAGGAEFQQILLARWLRDHGHEVSLVVGDFGQPEVEHFEGFEIHRSFRLGEGNRKLRFVPDMLKLRRAIHRSRPDVVNQRSTSFYTGQCCWFAHECGAAFSFSLGIDYNCWPDLGGRAPRLIQWTYRWGIEHADLVLAQTEEQAGLMQRNFRCAPHVVPNVLEMPEARRPDEEGEYVLWVGSLARRKRPELFLDLARKLPDQDFMLIGGPGEDVGYDEEMAWQAASIPNLQWKGFVPPTEIGGYYRRARLLVGTSRLEGLPNTYLQAWSYGVPVISVIVDPDGVIARRGLGEVVGEDEDLAVTVRRWLSMPRERAEAGARGVEYVRTNHGIDHIAPLVVGLFERVVLY